MAVTSLRVSHSCFLIELGPICKSKAASLRLKSCEDHSLLKSYNGGLWKNNYRSGPIIAFNLEHFRDVNWRNALSYLEHYFSFVDEK